MTLGEVLLLSHPSGFHRCLAAGNSPDSNPTSLMTVGMLTSAPLVLVAFRAMVATPWS